MLVATDGTYVASDTCSTTCATAVKAMTFLAILVWCCSRTKGGDLRLPLVVVRFIDDSILEGERVSLVSFSVCDLGSALM